MKTINIPQLIASLLLLAGCVIRMVGLFTEIPFWLSLTGLVCQLISLVFYAVVLIKQIDAKKK